MENNFEFMAWFTALVIEAQDRDWAIVTEEPENYRYYFDAGMTVEEAIDDDMYDD